MTEKLVVMPGRRFGRLVVVREGPGQPMKNKTYRRRTMICRCDCGSRDVEVLLELLVAGSENGRSGTRSCGCLRRETSAANNVVVKTTHGMRRHYLYTSWTSMRARCGTQSNPGYGNYGGRGIVVYGPWQDFPTFVHDVEVEIGPRPEGTYPSGRPMYSIDRKDNDGNYEPGNIQWATAREQMLNRRRLGSLGALVVKLEDEKRRLEAEIGALRSELDMERMRYR
jgi:hypothetical protein